VLRIYTQADVPQGVDFPDIKIICTSGLPGTMVDILQRGGCALRNSDDDTLFVIFYEPWVHDISLDKYSKGNLGDPDRPRCPLKLSSKWRERAPFSCLKLVKSTTCLRAEFASYLNDTSHLGTCDSLCIESADLCLVSSALPHCDFLLFR
jgi:hypothetical protein